MQPVLSRSLPRICLLFCLGLLIPPLSLLAGSHPSGFNFHWAQTITGSGDQIVNALTVDGSGQIHATGSYVGLTDFHGSTLQNASLAGTLDLFVARYRASGELIWARSVGGPNREIGTGVASDSAGNTLVSGHFQVGALMGGIRLTNLGNSDGVLLKYTPAGTVLWSRVLGGPGDDNATGVATDAAGNAYVCGFAQGGASFGGVTVTNRGGVDVFLAKFDPSGTLLWVRTAGGSGVDVANGVALDGGGNVILTGYFSETAQFGNASITAAGNVDLFLAKFDSDGNVLWARSAGGLEQDYGFAVAADVDGSIAVVGTLRGTTQFGATSVTGTGLRSYVARYGSSGSLDWVKAFPANEARAVTWSSGSLYVSGNFLGTLQLGTNSVTSVGTLDVFLARLSGTGESEWLRSFGGTGLDHSYSVVRDNGPGCLVGGRFTDVVVFDSISVTNGGVGDAYISRLSPMPLLTQVPSAQTVVPGSHVEMSAAAIGNEPLTWRWFFNQTQAIAGADSPLLVLEDVSPFNAGVYSVAASNRYGAVTSSPAFLNVFGLPRPTVRVEGSAGSRFDLTNVDQVTVSLSNALPDVSIYYSLDGSAPTLGSLPYFGSFQVTTSVVLRAIAYDSNFASSETAPIPITLHLSAPLLRVNGVSEPPFLFTNAPNLRVELISPVPGIPIYYTLNGTSPLSNALPASNALKYLAPFAITQSVTLSASQFRSGVASDMVGPVSIQLVQEYPLDIDPVQDGFIAAFPSRRIHPSGTVVQLTAEAGLGWSFINWTGDASGTQAVFGIVMDRPKRVGARFGTPLSVTNVGNGTLRLEPSLPLYPRGSKIRAVAIPQSGNYLALWGGIGSGNVSPLTFTVDGPVPTLSALFSPLATNRFSLTLIPEGRVASVRATPQQVFYQKGTTVVIEAIPELGVGFAGWTGTLSTNANPWSFTIETNLVLHAETGPLSYVLLHSPSVDEAQFSFTLSAPTNQVYQLERSVDAVRWKVFQVLSNFSGEQRIFDTLTNPIAPVQLYRATSTNQPSKSN